MSRLAALRALPLLLLALPLQAAPNHLILTEATNVGELREVVRSLEERGAVIRHLFPPSAALGTVPEGLEGEDLPGIGFRVVREPGRVALEGSDANAAHGAWRALRKPRAEGPGGRFHPDLIEPEPWEIEAPLLPRDELPCSVVPWTSAYLLGDVSVGILMPESVSLDPAENTEDWSAARQDEVVAEIVEAADQLAAAYPDAGLDFFYEVHRDVPTGVEPINHPPGARGMWMSDVMEALGHSGTSAYVRDLRSRHGTDWAIAAYVVDSLNDPDGAFEGDWRFAFALLGGPWMVMTYDNDGWGIGNMDTVFAHEMGHNFDALDEYASAGKPCTARSGVLMVENQNSDQGCLDNHACIMRANSFPTTFCSWSEGQLGLQDSDGDTVPDLRDTPPQSAIDPAEPDPTDVPDVELTGTASAMPDRDEVSFWASHTLNTIAGVEYRLDGGAWTPADPADGAYDELCEEFTIALTGLSDGWHEVETRAAAHVCSLDDVEICDPPRVRLEESLASESFYVNTDCPEDAFEPNDLPGEGVRIPGGAVEELQLCAYDPDRFSVFLRDGAWLAATAEYVETGAPVALELRSPGGGLLDRGEGAAGIASVSLGAADETGWFDLVFAGEGEAETAYRLLVDSSCIDDRLEPNADAASSPRIFPGTTADLQLCEGDEDWYRISLSEGADLEVRLQHEAALGNLDLAVFDPDMALLDSSETGADEEVVTLTGLSEGVHAIRVRGAFPTDENRYDLTVTPNGCLDDLLEQDDLQGQAVTIAEGSSSGMHCANDEDWRRIDLAEDSFLRVTLGYAQADGDLDLEVRDADGIVLRRSAGRKGLERIDFETLPAGSYDLRVFAQDATTENDYDLDVTLGDPLLLFVQKRDQRDVILDWNDSGIECYRLRRHDRPDTFEGGLDTVIDIGDQDGHDPTGWEDIDRIGDRLLHYYRVFPSACSSGLVSVTKTADPYPVLGWGTQHTMTITVRNDGREMANAISVYDDMPRQVMAFHMIEIPPGAVDLSSDTGGAWGRGYIQVEGFDLDGGESARVVFGLYPDTTGGTPNDKSPVIRNQATATWTTDAGDTMDAMSDDPSTIAAFDSTDVIFPSNYRSVVVTAFWNQDVDIDLMVADPCGNEISVDNPGPVDCLGSPGQVERPGGCGEPWPWGWYEIVSWREWPVPTGEFEVSVRYADSNATDPGCSHGGPEDVVVLVEQGQNLLWSWVTLDPDETGWVPVMSFTTN